MCRLSSGSPSNATRSQTDLSGALVERDRPSTSARERSVRRVAVAVEAAAERRLRIAADRARDEDAIAPDDRARVREARDGRPPQDVLAGRDVPAVGQILAVGDAGRLHAAERRPAARGGAAAFGNGPRAAPGVRTIRRSGRTTGVPAGVHVLRSRIIRRASHSSDLSANDTRPPSTRYAYRPGPAQPAPPPDVTISTVSPAAVHVPFSAGHPCPSSANAPSGANVAVKAPNVSGVRGIGTAVLAGSPAARQPRRRSTPVV